MASMAGSDDPFSDPLLDTTTPSQPPHSSEPTQEHTNVPDTLAVGRNASLTLGTDSLIVLGREALPMDCEYAPHTIQMKRF